MRKIYLVSLLLIWSTGIAFGQCNILSNAVPGIMLDYQSTNLFNCSGVGFNPIQQKYYAVRAGNPGFPLETWSVLGAQLYTTTAGFDWRGMWWNPNTNQLEGNGYSNSGLWKANLDGAGNALNTGVSLFTGMAQPDVQSCGDYDPVANEVIYYFNGRIYRYSRATNLPISNYALVGCPVGFGNLNSTTVLYTGCVGKEIGVLDYVLKRIYLFQKNTGNYVGMCQLPGAAVTTSSFRLSWANGLVWLFDLSLGNWYSYQIFDVILPESPLSTNAIWISPSATRVDWESSNTDHVQGFEVERSVDGRNFSKIGSRSVAEFDADNGEGHWSLQDAALPEDKVIYYRVKMISQDNSSQYSEVMELVRSDAPTDNLQAWPVPADQRLQIRFGNAVAGSQLEVFDAAGRRMCLQQIDEAIATQGNLELQTADWAQGMYLLSLKSRAGQQLTQRIAVQH